MNSEEDLRRLQRENHEKLMQRLDTENEQLSSLLSSMRSEREEAGLRRESRNKQLSSMKLERINSEEDLRRLQRENHEKLMQMQRENHEKLMQRLDLEIERIRTQNEQIRAQNEQISSLISSMKSERIMNYKTSITEALDELLQLDQGLYNQWVKDLCDNQGNIQQEFINEKTNKQIWQTVSSLYPEP